MTISPNHALYVAVGDNLLDHNAELDLARTKINHAISKAFAVEQPPPSIVVNLDGLKPFVIIDAVLDYRKAGWHVSWNPTFGSKLITLSIPANG